LSLVTWTVSKCIPFANKEAWKGGCYGNFLFKNKNKNPTPNL
jgi:hypothetical protein